MAHNHGSEYQVRIVHEDGTEELSGWLNSAGQVAQAIAASHRPQAKAYSRYLVEVGSKNRYELEVVIWNKIRAA